MISELGVIDKDMDRGVFDDDTVFRRFELKHKLLNVSEMESKDNFQKSKVKWAVEGDENSKFFHGIINKRRAQLAIRGIFVDGFGEKQNQASILINGSLLKSFLPSWSQTRRSFLLPYLLIFNHGISSFTFNRAVGRRGLVQSIHYRRYGGENLVSRIKAWDDVLFLSLDLALSKWKGITFR
ncbi:hypothetical protein Tco_0705384 [Tanacetum coccineum]|uniref:RNA-directed DNA polymerase, eukaryota n=1 Tax=Tanacetum coccineum TaxID=301880 RepID=A0ABQ4Y6F8_9ASTR